MSETNPLPGGDLSTGGEEQPSITFEPMTAVPHGPPFVASSNSFFAKSSFYSGPIPHPDILRGFEQVSPGFADRILKMAEEEAAHRHKKENRLIEENIEDARAIRKQIGRGQICALAICLTSIICGAFAVIFGHSTSTSLAGGSIGVIGLASISYIFISGKKAENEEDGKAKKESSDLPLFDQPKN